MTEPEPTAEQRAAALLMMDDEVKKLIRDTIVEALSDLGFVNRLLSNGFLLSNIKALVYNDPEFQKRVAVVIRDRINTY